MSVHKAYTLNLASLPEGHHEMDCRCDTEFFRMMESPDVYEADIDAHIDVDRKGDAYHILITLEGDMRIPCDRCLEPMVHEVDAEYGLTVRYGDEYNDSLDDVLILPWNEREWDLSRVLCDTVMLTVPLRHVHDDGECDLSMTDRLKEITREDIGEEDLEKEREV